MIDDDFAVWLLLRPGTGAATAILFADFESTA
jgi:hypothetical protein